jgi:hypothetical protein
MILGASQGVVLMAYPSDDAAAKTTFAGLLSAIKPGTKVLVAESFGGKDEPVDTLIKNLVGVKADTALDTLRVRDIPSQSLYQQFEEAGTDLAQLLTAKDAIAKKKAAMPPDMAKAIGRLSTGIYIVSAQHNNARSAMVASWVSQASFEPLGLTVAVAKDRAIESMMQVGGGVWGERLPRWWGGVGWGGAGHDAGGWMGLARLGKTGGAGGSRRTGAALRTGGAEAAGSSGGYGCNQLSPWQHVWCWNCALWCAMLGGSS